LEDQLASKIYQNTSLAGEPSLSRFYEHLPCGLQPTTALEAPATLAYDGFHEVIHSSRFKGE
jgi:hypothetical protein